MDGFLKFEPLPQSQQFQLEVHERQIRESDDMAKLQEVCVMLLRQNAQQMNLIKTLLKERL